MPSAKTLLLVALGAFTVFYVLVWIAAIRGKRLRETGRPSAFETAIGFVTNFFDTLGIGSFATTTSIYRFRNVVPDQWIPGTLNVGHTLPAIAQAFIYITIVEVDVVTLIAMIGASVLGSWLGAGVVARWPRLKIRLGMGLALLAAAALMLGTQLELFPKGGDTLSLTGTRFAIGVAGNALLGALMTMGIGLYAPCLILVSLLGMNPKAAFPIMMGSCAFLMPVASARFVREGSFSPKAALGLAIGGIPAVLIAAFIVKSLPLSAVRWLVVVVVVYTAVSMLRAAMAEMRGKAEPTVPATEAGGATP